MDKITAASIRRSWESFALPILRSNRAIETDLTWDESALESLLRPLALLLRKEIIQGQR